MAEMLPQGSPIRLGDRDKLLDRIDEARDELIAEQAPDDQGLLSLQAGIERENYTSRWLNDKMRSAGWSMFRVRDPRTGRMTQFTGGGSSELEEQFTPDPNYRFEEDDANFGYNPMVMKDAESEAEAISFRAQIDQEYMQLEEMNKTAWGVVGQVYGGVFQPHVAASLAIAPVSIAGAVAAEVALEGASEAMLHEQQKTRTLNESYWNVGLTAAGVGILGLAAKGMGKMKAPARDIIDDINMGIPAGSATDSAGAARVVDQDAITQDQDALIGGTLADVFSIGQMSNLVKSASQTARDVAQRLADNPLFTRAHAEGKTRGVSVEALHEAAMGRVVIATDKAAALAKVAKRATGMSSRDFDEAVGKAMSEGDKHVVPEVQAAAEMYRREVVEPIRTAAEKAGILEGDEAIKVKIAKLTDDVERMVKAGETGETAKTLDMKTRTQKRLAAYHPKVKKSEDIITGLQKTIDNLNTQINTARATPGAKGKPGKAKQSDISQRTKTKEDLKKAKKEHKALKDRQEVDRKKLEDVHKVEKANRDRPNAKLAKARKDIEAANRRLGTAFAESYFPRVYDKNKIFDNWQMLEDKLFKHFSDNPDIKGVKEVGEIREMVLDTMQNMVGSKSQMKTGKGVPSALRARVLSLMDTELEPFLEKGATKTMLGHAQAMQPYILMREAFQGRTMDDMFSAIDDEYNLLLSKATGPESKKLLKAKAHDRDNLQVIHDRLMHQVQRSLRPRSAVERTLQASKVWNVATMLGGIVLSSLPDIARPITHYGMRSFAKGVGRMSVQWLGGGKAGISSTQVKRTGAALQRTLNDRAMQLTDSLEMDSKFVQGMQKQWGKWTGFDAYTDVMESVAAHAAMDYVVRNAAKVASGGKLSGSATKQLTRMGLDLEDLKALHTETVGTRGAQDTVLKYMNTMEWKDFDLAKRVEAAIGSDVRRTIIRIGVAEKPAFMDGTTYSWLFQFQSFAMSAQNKMLVAGLQNLSLNTGSGMVAMMALGAGVGGAKGYLRGDDISKWGAEQWLAEGVDRSGLTGILRVPFNMLRYAGAKMGYTDSMPSRYMSREVAGVILPPFASTFAHAVEAGHQGLLGEGDKALEHAMKATPFINNTWHIREVLTQLGDS